MSFRIEKDSIADAISTNTINALSAYNSTPDVFSLYYFGAKGDGVTDDTSALERAFQAASENPWLVISFPPGTFLVRGTLQVPAKTTLQGQGGVIRALPAQTVDQQILFRTDADDVSIQDVSFDGSLVSDSFGGVFIFFKGTGARVQYRRNRFFNIPAQTDPSQQFTAMLLDNENAMIEGNYIVGGGGDLIGCNSGFFSVVGNYLENSENGGVAFNNSATGIISGNKIVRCFFGIGVGPMGNTSDADKLQDGIIIQGNELTNCRIGIDLGWFDFVGRTSPSSVTISSNVIKGSYKGIAYDGNGITNASINIVGNDILSLGKDQSFWGYPSDGEGIRFLGGGASIVSNIITGCYTNSVTAIHVGGENIVVSSNMITGNTFEGNNFLVGISSQTISYAVVSTNLVRGATTGLLGSIAPTAEYLANNIQ